LSTKLRLLLDECVPGPLVIEIQACTGILSVEVIDANHFMGNCRTPDEAVVAYATQENRILVTTEGRLNEKKFKICTHAGIIVLKVTQKHDAEKGRLFTRFMQSGHRGKCSHAVTKLRDRGSIRLERTEDGMIKEVLLNF
jgi:hypothetical protein